MLYEKINYDIQKEVTVSDNSNFTCVILNSGPPNGTIIGNSTVVTLKATDGVNDVFCSFNVHLKGI